MTGETKFQSQCEKLVIKLQDEGRKKFEKVSDDLQRIIFIYELAKETPIELANWAPKDFQRSLSLKLNGNKLFQTRNLFHAINVYNEALLRCPQDCIEAQELHDILIANRSAVFFELKEYEKVLKDVELVKAYNHHPAIYKLLIRAGKSCEALKKSSSALDYYTEAKAALTSGQFDEDEVRKQLVEVTNNINLLKGKKLVDVACASKDAEMDIEYRNMGYPALSSKVCVKSSPELGRFIVAKDDIKAGEIVAVEEPFVSVVNGSTYRMNCAYCLISTNQPVACELCSQVCFCSLACKQSASFHKVECKMLLTLYDIEASVNCLMALRMITKKDLDAHLKEAKELKKERNVVIYKTTDYYNVTQLVSHWETRSFEDFLHYSLISTFLLRLLKMSGYFGETDDASLTEDEAYIGSLILKNLQILQFNAHEISELNNDVDGDYKTESVGAGLYPTLALFNHSCNPSVIRYNIGNVMVLRAIKPIKRKEGVFENYGLLFTNSVRDARIATLRSTYRFDCYCQACTENWPLFQDISKTELKIACDCGSSLIADSEIDVFMISCKNCKKEKNIIPTLTALIPLAEKSNEVEELYAQRKYGDCGKLISELLDVYTKTLLPPISDMIILQHRLKTCLIYQGNKHFNFK
ncbi:PREDICTED: SET and MYND domain-containing protein 4-like [Nicrophorus vespilloides]|uniref:Protein-lysine N-methyltransferase SMYD4 n=1 Tax=Nicrophorus vespilloides TaxID=110193 RepID=A0ABM1MVX0_NICVS|nr:PREDICTED: SET and MYND domain-containing protein 4-like [Nicrophorus vespilloides]